MDDGEEEGDEELGRDVLAKDAGSPSPVDEPAQRDAGGLVAALARLRAELLGVALQVGGTSRPGAHRASPAPAA